ncbi:MAG: hypothetical protein ACR2P3_09375 [Geminicoccaceae bacterium]
MIRTISLALSLFSLSTLEAVAFEGTKTIYAVLADDTRIVIGKIDFEPEGDAVTYSCDLDESVFSEHFLSMRPFKCLDLDGQTVCHLTYPYELRGKVEPPDWRDLEYRLLFLFKEAGDYGINFENGYYFRFEQDGSRLLGNRLETNMGQLASPPPDDVRYPLDEAELYESEGDSHRLRWIIVE